jgi:hypothetical protein
MSEAHKEIVFLKKRSDFGDEDCTPQTNTTYGDASLQNFRGPGQLHMLTMVILRVN